MGSAQSNSSGSHRSFQAIDKVVSAVETFFVYVAGLFLVLMLITVALGIYAREVLNDPILWTNDLAGYLLMYSVMIAAPWVLKQQGHVKVDLFSAKLKGLSLKLNTLIIAVISMIAFSLFFWFSMETTISLYQKGTVMYANVPWPKFALIAPLAIGSFFIVIRIILIISGNLLGVEDERPDDVEEEQADFSL